MKLLKERYRYAKEGTIEQKVMAKRMKKEIKKLVENLEKISGKKIMLEDNQRFMEFAEFFEELLAAFKLEASKTMAIVMDTTAPGRKKEFVLVDFEELEKETNLDEKQITEKMIPVIKKYKDIINKQGSYVSGHIKFLPKQYPDSIKEEGNLQEGIWALPETEAHKQRAINDLQKWKTHYYSIVGDDEVFNGIDSAIKRIKELPLDSNSNGRTVDPSLNEQELNEAPKKFDIIIKPLNCIVDTGDMLEVEMGNEASMAHVYNEGDFYDSATLAQEVNRLDEWLPISVFEIEENPTEEFLVEVRVIEIVEKVMKKEVKKYKAEEK